jgi:hypothetical protein
VHSHNKKLMIGAALIFSIMIVNGGVLMLIYPNLYQGAQAAEPTFTPGITPSVTTRASNTPVIEGSLSNQTQTIPTITSIVETVTQKVMAPTCVHSTDYWSNHTQDLPVRLRIGNTTYTKDEEIAGFNHLVEDISDYLFIQMTTAFLNYNHGSYAKDIGQRIIDSANWLEKYPSGSKIGDFVLQEGYRLGIMLADYNNGLRGPGLCPGEPTSVPLEQILPPTPTHTSTPTATRTARSNITRVPTKTPTQAQPPNNPPRSAPSTPTHTPVQPTKAPSLKPTDEPLPTATQTPPQEPTSTPIPPTPVPPVEPTVAPMPAPTNVPETTTVPAVTTP